MIVLFLCIFFSFFVSHISRIFCIFPVYWNKKNPLQGQHLRVCTYIEELHWQVSTPNELKLFSFYPWTKSFQWPFWNWGALTSWNEFFFFIRKKCEEWRETINFLFLRNHNKNFGNKCQKIRERWKKSIPQLSFYFLYLTVY